MCKNFTLHILQEGKTAMNLSINIKDLTVSGRKGAQILIWKYNSSCFLYISDAMSTVESYKKSLNGSYFVPAGKDLEVKTAGFVRVGVTQLHRDTQFKQKLNDD